MKIASTKTSQFIICPAPNCGMQVSQLTDRGVCLRCTAKGIKAKGKRFRKYNCETCDKEFIRETFSHKYCSDICAEAARRSGYFLLFRRDDFRCGYCGRSSIEDKVKLHLDHIIPYSKGGLTIAKNLVTTCEDCNIHKYNTLLRQDTLNRVKEQVKDRNKLAGISGEKKIKMINDYVR